MYESCPSAAFSCLLPLPNTTNMSFSCSFTPRMARSISQNAFSKRIRHHITSNTSKTVCTMSSSTRPKCRVFDLRDSCIPYHTGWDLQHELADELKGDASASDAVIMLEHQPVYTLGTASRLDHVLFDTDHIQKRQQTSKQSMDNKQIGNDVMIVRTERGGEVTYHGPGQIVMYPIINLSRHRKDLHWYLRSLEEMIIHVLQHEYGLQGACRKKGLTGVWVDNVKVCAMGLKVSKWITMHGLALNVNMDLSPFSRIVPCGIHDRGVSSIQKLLENEIDTTQGRKPVCTLHARDCLLRSFDHVFGPYEFEHGDVRNLNTVVTLQQQQQEMYPANTT